MHRELYDVLGVASGATPDAIKSAYRSKSKQLHPDSGQPTADEEAFHRLSMAYTILRDADKRKKYDSDGTYDAGPTRTEHQIVLSLIAERIALAIQTNITNLDVNLLEIVRADLADLVQQAVTANQSVTRVLGGLERSLARIKTPDENNLFASALNAKLQECRNAKTKNDDLERRALAALDILLSYTSETIQTQPMFFGNSTNGPFVWTS